METSGKGTAIGIGGAVVACCLVHLVFLAGWIGALGGGLLASPALMVGGLAPFAAAVLAPRRVTRGSHSRPSPGTGAGPVGRRIS